MKKLLGYYDNNEDEFIFNSINNFCKEKIKTEKCILFYDNLKNLEDGIYRCPFHFNCVKSGDKIYNCLLIKDYFVNSKIKLKKGINQRVYTKEFIYSLIEMDEEYENNVLKCEALHNNVSDFLHDITKANQLIDKNSSSISKNNLVKNDKAKLESIIHLSDFITKRIDLYRYISNPALITAGRKRERDAYKLWDIYRYVFTEIGYNSKITINMTKYDTDGNEQKDLKTTFIATDSITILPFLIIDNAMKYSDEKSIIRVKFFSDNGLLKKIQVCSTPSYVITEHPNVFLRRGYRSPNNTSKSSGSGLGLHIVKQICDYNDINLSVEIGVDKNGKQEFIVNLDIICK